MRGRLKKGVFMKNRLGGTRTVAPPNPLRQYVSAQFHYTRRLLGLGLNKGDVVHELRLVLKRLRAVTALFKARPGFTEMNQDLKKLSRALGPRRDHDIVENWLANHRNTTPEHLLSTFRSQPLPARLLPVALIRERLLALEARILELMKDPRNIQVDGRDAIRRGYRKIKVAARRARKTKKNSDYHALRKRLKTFQYQMESLGLADAGKVKTVLKKMPDITSMLGKSHDLLLIKTAFEKLHRADLKPLCRKVLNMKDHLNRQALRESERILEKAP
jgi:CHAD domain-containing protein